MLNRMEISQKVQEETKMGMACGGPALAKEDPWTPPERALADSIDALLQDFQHELLKNVLRLHHQGVANSLGNLAVNYGRQATERKDNFDILLDSDRSGMNVSPGKHRNESVVLDLDHMKIARKIGMPSIEKGKDDFMPGSADDEERSEKTNLANANANDEERDGKTTSGSCGVSHATQFHYEQITMLAQKLHGRDVLTTPLQVFVCSTGYTLTLCVAILFQAILMGWEAHVTMTYEVNRVSRLPATPVPEFLEMANYVLVVLFTIDVIVRLAVLREKFLFANNPDSRGWNIFDLVVVILCLPDLLPAYDFVNLSILRTLRVMRVIRVLNVARGVKELRKMIFALIHCMSALFWLFSLMSILVYMFALVFMQGASLHLATMEPYDLNATEVRRLRARGDSSSGACDDALHPYTALSGLDISMRSLFNVVVGNEDWTIVLKAVTESSALMTVWSFFFSAFFFFGFMNVATGVFVEKAMQIATQDRDMMMAEQVAKEEEEIQAMRELFQGADADGDGSLTKKELKEAILHPDVKSWLSSIELDISDDIDNVLTILDPKEEGSIQADDFYALIGRFRGKARSVELMLVLMEARKTEVLTRQTLQKMQADAEKFHAILIQVQVYMDDVLKSHRKYNV